MEWTMEGLAYIARHTVQRYMNKGYTFGQAAGRFLDEFEETLTSHTLYRVVVLMELMDLGRTEEDVRLELLKELIALKPDELNLDQIGMHERQELSDKVCDLRKDPIIQREPEAYEPFIQQMMTVLTVQAVHTYAVLRRFAYARRKTAKFNYVKSRSADNWLIQPRERTELIRQHPGDVVESTTTGIEKSK